MDDRYRERTGTPECEQFTRTCAPLWRPTFDEISLRPVGPVRFYGSDPKGAGSLFLAFFASQSVVVRVRTVDGAVDVMAGPVGTPPDGSDSGWFWTRQTREALGLPAPHAQALVALEARLREAGPQWG